MKIILFLTLLISTQLCIAQMFPWQPKELVLNEKDTFILVERIEFDADNRLRWLTDYEFDDRGVNTRKVQLDGKTKVFYDEQSMRENDSSDLQRKYRKYIRDHQDSIKRIESLSCYDEKNRLLWELKYNASGEVIDSLSNIYDEDGLVRQNTWNSSFDLYRTVKHEQISKMSVIYSDTGKFRMVSFVNIKHYHNGMESKSSSTTTYQYDLNQNLIEERYYWDDPTAAAKMLPQSSEELALLPTRVVGDTLRQIILRKYDLNDNLIYAAHSNSLDSEPFQQEHYEYDKKGRLVKSYLINAEGIQTGVTLIDYRKRGNNTEATSTQIGDKFTGEQASVSLIDVNGRYLECVTFYEGVKVTADKWTYLQNGNQYQVELKQNFLQVDDGDSEMVLTRWIYEKK